MRQDDASAVSILHKLHSVSASLITMESRRLVCIQTELDDAKRDLTEAAGDISDAADLEDEIASIEAEYITTAHAVRQNIHDFVEVTDADKNRCAKAFHKAINVDMRVCGACGLRDISDPYPGRGIGLFDLEDRFKWLEIPDGALERLKADEPFELMGTNSTPVQVQRAELHNFFECGDRAFHVVPEAVTDGKVDLCSECFRHRVFSPSAAGSFYCDSAPPNSISSSADYGRLSNLEAKGIVMRPSTLETLVLAKSRCYQVVVKVVAPGANIAPRARLHGHTIIFPHEVKTVQRSAGPAATMDELIRGAMLHARVLFVAPNGRTSALEKSALLVNDLRLRAEVLFNHLTLDAKLRDGYAPPDLQTIRDAIAANSVQKCLVDTARVLTDDAVERASVPSDVANVRAAAQSEAHRTANDGGALDSSGGDGATPRRVLQPDMETIGVLQSAQQGIGAVIDGIAKAFDGLGDDGGADRDALAPRETEPPVFVAQRAQDPTDDYIGASGALYGAWWPLFPLRQGLRKGEAVLAPKIRHLMLYHDNRYAHDIPLMFHLANTTLRHAVNRAVGAKVKSNAKAFAEFSECVNDPGFLSLLEAAKADPKGEEARKVLQRVLRFIDLAGRVVPWGTRERAGEITKLLAFQRDAGASSIFLSLAPDDVHNPTSIRYSYPFKGPDKFPAVAEPDFLTALRGGSHEERKVGAFDMSEHAVQRLASANPIAVTMVFDHIVSCVYKHLVGLGSTDRRTSQPLLSRMKGLFGMCVHYNFVKENNKRAAQHVHSQLHGGASPALLADVAHDASLLAEICRALDTQVVADLPLEYHAVGVAQKVLRSPLRRDAAYPAPDRATDPAAFLHHARHVATNRHIHSHQMTCTHGLRGKTGCRMCAPWGHGQEHTSVVELTPLPAAGRELYAREDFCAGFDDYYAGHDDRGAGESTVQFVAFRCPECYADGVIAGEHSRCRADPNYAASGNAEEVIVTNIRTADATRDIAYTASPPSNPGTTDRRVLALELRRPLLPSRLDGSVLAQIVSAARKRQTPLEFPPGTGGDSQARDTLKKIIDSNEPLGVVLKNGDLSVLAHKLTKLTQEPIEGDEDNSAAASLTRVLIKALTAVGGGGMACANSNITDLCEVFAGCTAANAAAYANGSGAAAKAAAFYQIKYMGKDTVDISASASVLIDARRNIDKYPSKATDTGEADRTAKHYTQRVLNFADMELDATSAAGICLNQNSSGSSDTMEYFYGWDHVRVLLVLMERARGDGGVRGRGDDSDGYDDADTDKEADGDADGDTIMEQVAGYVDEEQTLFANVSVQVGGGIDAVGAEQHGLPAFDSVVDDSIEADAAGPELLAEQDGSNADAAAGAGGADDGDGGLSKMMRCFEIAAGTRTGNSGTFTTATGERIAVSSATHYAFRSKKLGAMNALEFFMATRVCKMDAEDKKWRQTELVSDAGCGDLEDAGDHLDDGADAAQSGGDGGAQPRGRPRKRYLLLKGHPLFESHILVVRAKWGVPAFAGEPPPSEPKGPFDSRASRRLARDYARFYTACFIPWSADELPASVSRAEWVKYIAELEREAGFNSMPVDRGNIDGQKNRVIAAGRLFKLDNIRNGLRVEHQTSVMLGKHRARSRARWGPDNRPDPSSVGGGANAAERQAVKDLADINSRAASLREENDTPARTKDSAKFDLWRQSLCVALPSKVRGVVSAAGEGLKRQWAAAARPSWRSKEGTSLDPSEVDRLLKEPLAARSPTVFQENTHMLGGRAADVPPVCGTNVADGVFADISGEEYDIAAASFKERANTHRNDESLPDPGKPPLNPEQRDAGRGFLEYVTLRCNMRREGKSAVEIAESARAKGISQLTLLIGAGGTGKSAVVHSIESHMSQKGLGFLLITAYTGVATAPFGGPTLMSLLNFTLAIKEQTLTSTHSADKLHAMREKFTKESGMKLEDVGGIVIDECSFITAAMYGHVDMTLRQLLDVLDVVAGGIPVMLAGDCHQKSPAGGTAFYKTMVDAATRENGEPAPISAVSKGLVFIRKARRVQLHRLMRARDDPPFIADQLHMRRHDVDQPVTHAFVRRLRVVSRKDLADDEGWRFAPVAVLSTYERDVINIDQMDKFARAFNCALIKYKLPLKFQAGQLDADVLAQLYATDDRLWGYFVEGAPANLTENIKAVRKLVNGSCVLLDSLIWVDNAIPPAVSTALSRRCYCVVELEEIPSAVCVRVSGGLWHGVELEDLSSLVDAECSIANNDIIIPVKVGRKREVLKLHSLYAAQHALPGVCTATNFPVMPAFALTDFKLQGRTLPKLILSICARPVGPFLALNSFYVMISRVTSMNGLRLLQFDGNALYAATSLQHDPKLAAWDQGYDGAGCWNGELAVSALKASRSKLAAWETKKRAKKTAMKRAARAAAAKQGRAQAKKHPPTRGSSVGAAAAKPPGQKIAGAPAACGRTITRAEVAVMRIVDLKQALAERSLGVTGLKDELKHRLLNAINTGVRSSGTRCARSVTRPFTAATAAGAAEPSGPHVDPTAWAQVNEYWAGMNISNKHEIMAGVDYVTRGDFSTLKEGGQLTEGVLNEIARHIVADAPGVALLSSFFLTKVAPITGPPQNVRPRHWTVAFGTGEGSLIGVDRKYLVAPHFVPGHWCCAVADLERNEIRYYDPLYNGTYSAAALGALCAYVDQVNCEQGAMVALGAASFPRAVTTSPKQPDGVSCGVCVLLEIQRLVDGGLNGTRNLEFTKEEISAFRAKWACLLLRVSATSSAIGPVNERYVSAARRARIAEAEFDVIVIDHTPPGESTIQFATGDSSLDDAYSKLNRWRLPLCPLGAIVPLGLRTGEPLLERRPSLRYYMRVIDHYDRGDCRARRVVEWAENLGFEVAATLTQDQAASACGYIAVKAHESLIGGINGGGWMRMPLDVLNAAVVPDGNMYLYQTTSSQAENLDGE